MHLTRLLMGRAAWISLACLLATLILALGRAQVDVSREGAGAAEAARLMGHLSALQTVPPEGLGEELRSLRELAASGVLRHLRFRLEDGAGRVLVPAAAEERGAGVLGWVLDRMQSPPSAATYAWQLHRADGRDFRVTFIGNPASERQEAENNILGLALVLLFYTVTLLAGLYWAVRHAIAPLRNILSAIDAWERQDYGRRLPGMPVRELDAIGGALNRLATALQAALEERRILALRVLSLQEDERVRLARELHDEFGQAVTAMRADATWLARKLEAGEMQAVARDLGERCGALQGHMRSLLRQLRPQGEGPDDAPVPLRQLVEDLVRQWQTLPDMATEFDCRIELGERPLSRALALTLYRLTQEALTNVARHAGPCRVEVRLRALEGYDVVWSVTDSGRGMDCVERALQQGNGLTGMRERVWAHGGRIDVLCGAAGGVCVAARFGWPEQEEEK